MSAFIRGAMSRAGGVAAAVAIAAGTAAAAPVGSDWTSTECGTYSGTGCSPTAQRVDLTKPVFTTPIEVTNPLYPVKSLQSVVMLGLTEGDRFRSESTLLPRTQVVEWDGKKIETLIVQYTAYRNGRIEEVAIDRYAQADDGSVWYLGEDVVDYARGTVVSTEGTWLAGIEGPPAMIMPAAPKLGDVFRTENVVGVVFEEMRVKQVAKTVVAARGPISGAIVADELHLDGTHSDKVLAPGRGEFSTIEKGPNFENLVLSVPADAVAGPPPPQLADTRGAANGMLGAIQSDDWEAAAAIARRISRNVRAIPAAGRPLAVIKQLRRSLNSLNRAVSKRRSIRAGQATIDLAQSVIDLQLQYRSQVATDRDRFELWCHQVLLDAAARNKTGVLGDVAALEWIRDRFAHALDPAEVTELDQRLGALRTAADAGQLASAGDHAARLGQRLRSLGVR